MTAQHSSKQDSWGTPESICRVAHRLLGGIDLDPCSDAHWNATVQAMRIFTKRDDSLFIPWGTREDPSTVFLNPPGGKRGNQSNAALFWEKLMVERAAQRVTAAVFIGFSMEIMQTTQSSSPRPSVANFPHVIPAKRIRYHDKHSPKALSPTHGSVIAYVYPSSMHSDEAYQLLLDHFGYLGVVCPGAPWVK